MRLNNLFASAGLLAILAATSAHADSIQINNSVFGNSITGASTGQYYGALGWTLLGNGDAGTYTAQSLDAPTLSTANAAWVATGAGLQQSLSGLTLQADTTYSLSGDFIGRISVPTTSNGYVALEAGSGKVINLQIAGSVEAGAWQTFTGTFTTSALTTGLGQALSISAFNTGTGELDFTNVKLTAINNAPASSATPELSSSLMIAMGLVGFGLMARRRQTA
jgi:hypothetical protein